MPSACACCESNPNPHSQIGTVGRLTSPHSGQRRTLTCGPYSRLARLQRTCGLRMLRREMAKHLPVVGGHEEGFCKTKRTDNWWAGPGITLFVFSAFVVYTTWAALQGNHYFVD